MALTTAQQATLKAHIAASPDLNIYPNNSDGAFEIARLLEQTASPDFWVWRTSVEKKEVVQQQGRTGTSFVWAGNGFIGRSAGELECWNQLFNSSLTCNPSLPNVRQAFVDIFSGTGNAATNRTHLDAIARRKANRLEKLFATGTGGDTSATAGTMVVEGRISYQEVEAARNS
jgi:hypothetical protein